MTEIILTSSVLILLLALLRRPLRGRVPPAAQYALWLLAAARLLIPGTLFDAPVSVLGAAEGLQTSLHETFPDPESLPEPLVNDTVNQLPQQEIVPAIPPSGAVYPDGDIVVNYRPAVSEIARKVCNWPDVIWKTGIAVTSGALVLSNMIFYLRLRKNRKRLTLPDTLWSGKLPVYVAEGLPSPCLFGVFRPAVYLNEAALDAAHPEHILAHERAHYRHGDHLWAVLRCVCLAVHWYNPLVWWAAALSRRDCELACDASALRRLGEQERIDYGRTLLGMASGSRRPAALLQTATTMTAGKRAMKERVALIARRPRTRKAAPVLAAALACLLAACTFGGKAETPEKQEPPEAPEAPAAVYLMEMLSSQYRPGVITDPDIVSRLWELYQGFTFDGTTEEFTRDNAWSVTAAFGDGEGNSLAHFTIWAGGLCWLEDDYETFHVLRDGQAIYEEFRDCCRTAPRDENYPPAGADGTDALDEVLTRLQENAGEPMGVSYAGKTGAPANGTLAESERAALEEAFRACRWTRAEDPGDSLPYWHRTSVGGFSFYDGSPLVSCGEDWYYVPEGYLTVQAALFHDTDPDLTLAEKKGLYLYEQARGEWNSFQFGWMHERYDGVFEDEEGLWPSVGFFESVADMRGYLETMFSPELAEYLMDLRPLAERDGRLHFLSGGGGPNLYAGDETYRAFPLSPEDAARYGYNGHIFAQTAVLDWDLETVADYKRHDYFYVWNGTHYVFTSFGPCDDVDPQLYHNAEEIVAQVQRGVDAGQWLPLLNCVSWDTMGRAAAAAGMDGTRGVMSAIKQYAGRRGGDMTEGEYLSVLSAAGGLDGAYAEGYGCLLYKMYAANPGRFAYVTLELLTEDQRNDALDLFRGEWFFHLGSVAESAPSREEAAARLERDLSVSVSASPADMTLHSPGETFRLQLRNAHGVYAATYASSDPGVASVDENGVVTAVSPGAAVVTLRYEGAGGPWDFGCGVYCDW